MDKPNMNLEVTEGQVKPVPMRLKLMNYIAQDKVQSIWAVLCACYTVLMHVGIGAIASFAIQYIAYSYFERSVEPLRYLNNKDRHIIFCTVGYHLMIAVGILTLNSYNGCMIYLKPNHKIRAHWIIQIIGSLCALYGTIVIYDKKIHNYHGLFGVIAAACTLLSLLNSVCALFATEIGCSKLWIIFHALVGIAAMVFSSISFVIAIMQERIILVYRVKQIQVILISLITFYTIGLLLQTLRTIYFNYNK